MFKSRRWLVVLESLAFIFPVFLSLLFTFFRETEWAKEIISRWFVCALLIFVPVICCIYIVIVRWKRPSGFGEFARAFLDHLVVRFGEGNFGDVRATYFEVKDTPRNLRRQEAKTHHTVPNGREPWNSNAMLTPIYRSDTPGKVHSEAYFWKGEGVSGRAWHNKSACNQVLPQRYDIEKKRDRQDFAKECKMRPEMVDKLSRLPCKYISFPIMINSVVVAMIIIDSNTGDNLLIDIPLDLRKQEPDKVTAIEVEVREQVEAERALFAVVWALAREG
jgi:hypothetical protein